MPLPRWSDESEELKREQMENPARQTVPGPVQKEGVSQGDMMAAGINPFVKRPKEVAKQTPGTPENKDWLWDMILFSGAAVAAAPITGGLSLPLWAAPAIMGGLYGGAKIGQELVTGRNQPTVTEEVMGKDLPLPVSGMIHAGEAMAFEGLGKAIIKGARAVKPLQRASDWWQPKADIIFENIKIPGGKKLVDLNVPFTQQENLGKRTVREVMEPAIARLRGSKKSVNREAGMTATTSETNKRLATIASVNLEKEMLGLSLQERRMFTRRWRAPKFLKKLEEGALKQGNVAEAEMYSNVRFEYFP